PGRLLEGGEQRGRDEAGARGDRHVYAARTRFIPASLLSAFEQTSWASVQAKDDPRRRPEVKVDLGARMRGMWK
ncbi:ATP-dependent helicase, partial [Mesorhizobium sp. M4B.F.Ca.ET.049.02.1.2]